MKLLLLHRVWAGCRQLRRLWLLGLLGGCGQPEQYRLVGAVPVGSSSWTYRLYQENEFDFVTGVYYELYYREQRRSEKHLLFGSEVPVSAADFRPGRCGPVLFLAFDTTRAGYALYDTRWRPGYLDSVRLHENAAQQMQREIGLLRQVQACYPHRHHP
jgi:hypothetical protein